MSNVREVIIDHFFDILEGISTDGGYNTNPVVERERQHFYDTVNFPALLLDEGEPELIESFAFGVEQNTLTLLITGRVKHDSWSELNKLVEDVRKVIESSTNTYTADTFIDSVQAVADPNSTLKEFEMRLRVNYRTNYGQT